MANDQNTLNGKLDTQLRDASDQTWAATEKDDLIAWAIAGLVEDGVFRPLAPASYTQALTAGTYTYALNSAIRLLTGVDRLDADGNELGPMPTGSWRTEGDVLHGSGSIRLSPMLVDAGGTLRYTGYGAYDLTTNYIPDAWVPYILASARAEAYRRMGGDRARFKQWANSNQVQNISVNELLQLISEAESEKRALKPRVWTRPRPARVG